MPTDAALTFADHMGRFSARRHAYPPMAGRLLGYLAVCDPPEQSIGDLSEALLASRSAIAGAELGELVREGLDVLGHAPPDRRAAVLEMAAFAEFLCERIPRLQQEWESHLEALRAVGELSAAAGVGGPGRR
ncbi:MAG: hypothetical protein JO130_18265 [Solirubrobacterales bacterium]|nr:hypothetical protein [Solirubrobacterales bacterium]